MTDAPRQTTTVSGLETAYFTHGEGSPVLALHGWARSREDFWPVAQQLARRDSSRQGYAIHALDLPGFGGTALPPEPWGVADYARFVIAFLDEQGLERVHLLGHSFGGRIGLILGADYPDRLDKMVLANSAGVRTPDNPVKTALRGAARAITTLPGVNALYQPVRPRLYRLFGWSTDYLEAGELEATYLRVVEEDLLPYAARVTRPTLLVWGDQDEETPLWQGQRLEATIPDAGLVVFQGAGHFCFLERLLEYVRIVDHFFAEAS